MKLLNRSLQLFLLTLSIVGLQASSSSTSVIGDLDLFFQPLRMTVDGMEIFFSNLYNSKRYTEDFFPQNFSHLTQFLEHGKQNKQGHDYIKATFSLFNQKIKGCLYTSAYAFDDFLSQLPNLVAYNFAPATKSIQARKDSVKQILVQEFYKDGLNNFSSFRENPTIFFDGIADKIITTIDPEINEEINLEALRQTIIRFVDSGLSKILWDANDKDIWHNVKLMAEHVAVLGEKGVIADPDDLNDLAWTLVHRLCYFIEITGNDLPVEFYHQARQDLENNFTGILALEEQETLMETKKHYLDRHLYQGLDRKVSDYSKRVAEEHGIFSHTNIS